MDHQEGHQAVDADDIEYHQQEILHEQEEADMIEDRRISSDEEEDESETVSVYDPESFDQETMISRMSELEKDQAMTFIGLVGVLKEMNMGEIMHAIVGECLDTVNFANCRSGVLVKLWYSRRDPLRVARPDSFEVGGIRDAIEQHCKVEVNLLSDNEIMKRVVTRTKFQIGKAIGSIKETWEDQMRRHFKDIEKNVEATTASMRDSSLPHGRRQIWYTSS